jgi:hypothetical protein
MGGPVEVEEGSSSGASSHCLWGLSPLTGPETGVGVADGEADEWGGSGGQLPLAGAAWQQHMAGGLLQKSKSIKDGWRVGSSCRIGFLGELTGVGCSLTWPVSWAGL